MLAMRSATLVLLLLSALPPAMAAGPEESPPLAKTREAFRLQLEDAKVAGIVISREEAPRPPALRDGPGGLAALRESEAECLTMERLRRSERSLADEPVAGLDRLRAALLAEDGIRRSDAEIDLAIGYLVLGFAEEARAIAAAQAGVEAAGVMGLALLMENRPEDVERRLSGAERCGAVYQMIRESADLLLQKRERLSTAAQDHLARLPSRIGQPIAEAMAAHALAAGADPEIYGRETPREDARTETSEAATFASAVADPSAESGVAKLLEIGSTPGMFRVKALTAASAKLDDAANREFIESFEANSADILDEPGGGEGKAKFSLLIARRRAAQGNMTGAAKALAAAYDHGGARNAALETHRELFVPLIRSSSSDDRLSALSAIVERPRLAADSLPASDMASAAHAAARLGAVQATNKLLSVLSPPAAEASLLRGEAAYRAGDLLGARSILEPIADSPAGAALFSRLVIRTADPEAPLPVSVQRAGVEAANVFWALGDFEALRGLASTSTLTGAQATQAVLAHLAADVAPSETLMRNTGDERMAALFAKAPMDVSDADGAAAFSNSIAVSLDYLKEAFGHE
jgi:hypothetical protein